MIAKASCMEDPWLGELPAWSSVSGYLGAIKRLDSRLERSEGKKACRGCCNGCGEGAEASREGCGRMIRKKRHGAAKMASTGG